MYIGVSMNVVSIALQLVEGSSNPQILAEARIALSYLEGKHSLTAGEKNALHVISKYV